MNKPDTSPEAILALADRTIETEGCTMRDIVETLRAVAVELEELRKNGPQIEGRYTLDGVPVMCSMRQVMEDYRMAAEAEADEVNRLNDEKEAQAVPQGWPTWEMICAACPPGEVVDHASMGTALRAALAAAPQAPEVSQWQPIETAPFHERILCGWPSESHQLPVILMNEVNAWVDDEGSEYDVPPFWMPLPEGPKT